MIEGFVFVGEIVEGKVEASVFFNDNYLSMSGRVWFTLDEWLEARRLTDNDDNVWCATEAEYAEATEVVVEQT